MKVVVQNNIDKCGVISVYLRSYSKGFERRQMKLEFNMFPSSK